MYMRMGSVSSIFAIARLSWTRWEKMILVFCAKLINITAVSCQHPLITWWRYKNLWENYGQCIDITTGLQKNTPFIYIKNGLPFYVWSIRLSRHRDIIHNNYEDDLTFSDSFVSTKYTHHPGYMCWKVCWGLKNIPVFSSTIYL